MTKVKIGEFRRCLKVIANNEGVPEQQAAIFADAIVAHFTEDNFFKGFRGAHGIEDWIEKIKKSQSINEAIRIDTPSMRIFDGNGKSPFHIIMQRFDELCSQTSKVGSFSIGVKGEYMSALFYTVRKFADEGYIAILCSNGGPQGTVPYGGKTDIFGTNPLAYGIPSSTDSIVFDAATSKRAWGLIAEHKDTGEPLPENTYLDTDGQYTTDAERAVKIEPFGGYKGYAINLLLEVMTSALVGGVAGRLQKDKNELGTWLYLIDPAFVTDRSEFLSQVDRIKEEIITTEPRDGFDSVVYPGKRAFESSQTFTEDSTIELDEATWKKIQEEAKQ